VIGATKNPPVSGASEHQKLKSRTCDGTTCSNFIIRLFGRTTNRRILRATPQDRVPRVPLDDQYCIPEEVLKYVMGWGRKPTDWIPKILFQAPSGQPSTLPRTQNSRGHQAYKKEWGKPLGLLDACTSCQKNNCGYSHTPVMKRSSKLVGGYRPEYTMLGDRGGWSTPCPIVYPPRMTPHLPLVEDPAGQWPIEKEAKGRKSTPYIGKVRSPHLNLIFQRTIELQ
jgi:hypothetical protein